MQLAAAPIVEQVSGQGGDAATRAPLTYAMRVFATLIGFVAFGTIEIAEKIDT